MSDAEQAYALGDFIMNARRSSHVLIALCVTAFLVMSSTCGGAEGAQWEHKNFTADHNRCLNNYLDQPGITLPQLKELSGACSADVDARYGPAFVREHHASEACIGGGGKWDWDRAQCN